MKLEIKARLAKRCPLCGAEAITETRERFYQRGSRAISYIRCEACDLTVYGEAVSKNGSFECSYNEAQHRVLARWNRRVMA